MGLVAAGLLLMLIQIMLKKPNSWLVTANAAALALVLYGCCFLNAPWVVASYNVDHCREVGGSGPNLDLKYLSRLDPKSCRPSNLVCSKSRKSGPTLSDFGLIRISVHSGCVLETGGHGASGHGVWNGI